MKTLLRLSGTIIFLILSLKFFQWCFIYICLSKPIQYDRCLESFLGTCVYKYLENRKHTEILFYRKNKIIKSISNKWKTVLSINKWCSKQNNVRFLLVCMCMYLRRTNIDSSAPFKLFYSEAPEYISGKYFFSLNKHSKWLVISSKFGEHWNVRHRIEDGLAFGSYLEDNPLASETSHFSGQ